MKFLIFVEHFFESFDFIMSSLYFSSKMKIKIFRIGHNLRVSWVMPVQQLIVSDLIWLVCCNLAYAHLIFAFCFPRFAYLEFLKNFVLNLQQQSQPQTIPEEGGDGDRLPLTRPKIHSSKVVVSSNNLLRASIEAVSLFFPRPPSCRYSRSVRHASDIMRPITCKMQSTTQFCSCTSMQLS